MIVEFEGKRHQFPDDATDAEIAAALGGAALAGKTPEGILPFSETLGRSLKVIAQERADAAAEGDTQAVAALDKELARTRKALERAQDRESTLVDDGSPAVPVTLDKAAPRASQADVRRMEQPDQDTRLPMERQRDDEAAFTKNWQAWIAATGGVLKPGQNVRQAVSDWSMRRDPAETRQAAQVAHLAETGELDGDEDTIGMQVGKPLAAMAGFALGGPAGATMAEGAVRAASLSGKIPGTKIELYTTALDKAVQAGTITPEEAQSLWWEKMSKGVTSDALFNFGVPFALKAVPAAAKWLGDKTGVSGPVSKAWKVLADSRAGQAVAGAVKSVADDAALGAPGGPRAPKPSQRDVKLADRAALTDDPARKKAVEELGKRTDDFVPTPGQVLGEDSKTETVIKNAFPEQFKRQEKALTGAADDMLRETTTPAGQMEIKDLGAAIQQTAKDAEKAVKTRLRPTFQAADDIGVQVDMREVRREASRALLADLRAAGKLDASERMELERVFETLRQNPNMTAEGTLDFISRRKELMRKMTAEGSPSKEFKIVLGKLEQAADRAYTKAAQAAGEGKVARDLLRARQQYGAMMETIYDDAGAQLLKKRPEDVGGFLWTSGNVSEIEQFHRMLRLAEKEGAIGQAGAQKLKQDVTQGFLQEAVRDVDSAALWLETLKKDAKKRRTWNTLTAGPDGAQMRSAMEVLSNAAQIAKGSEMASKTFIPLGRAAAGGVGVSYVTGVISPGMAVVGLSIAGTMRAMSTAYTHGEAGIVNLLARALKANSVGTAAGAKALQEAMPKIEKWAAENDIEDIFVSAADAAASAVSGTAQAADGEKAAPPPPAKKGFFGALKERVVGKPAPAAPKEDETKRRKYLDRMIEEG